MTASLDPSTPHVRHCTVENPRQRALLQASVTEKLVVLTPAKRGHRAKPSTFHADARSQDRKRRSENCQQTETIATLTAAGHEVEDATKHLGALLENLRTLLQFKTEATRDHPHKQPQLVPRRSAGTSLGRGARAARAAMMLVPRQLPC